MLLPILWMRTSSSGPSVHPGLGGFYNNFATRIVKNGWFADGLRSAPRGAPTGYIGELTAGFVPLPESKANQKSELFSSLRRGKPRLYTNSCLGQEFRRLFGVVSQNHAGAGAADAEQ